MGQRKARETAPQSLTLRKLLLRAVIGLVILGALLILSQPSYLNNALDRFANQLENNGGFDTHGGVTNGEAQLAPLFTSEVLYWQADLIRWGRERNVNPNLLATIMQIESCGDPYVSSTAGAQGLFQVMPFHFDNGENQINPEANAQNGIDHLVECLQFSNYDVGVSLACYNGGASVISRPYEQWFAETQAYYRWGTGIYADASQGASESRTLQEWLAAGGSLLCDRARFTLDTILPQVVREP